jgi:hypothetical protein
VGDLDGVGLQARSLADGSFLWSRDYTRDLDAEVEKTDGGSVLFKIWDLAATSQGDLVFISQSLDFDNVAVVAVSGLDGSVKWIHSVPAQYPTGLVLDEKGNVFIGAQGLSMSFLEDGTPRWRFGGEEQTLATFGGFLLAQGGVLRVSDGQLVYRPQIDLTSEARPTMMPGSTYVIAEGHSQVMDCFGRPITRSTTQVLRWDTATGAVPWQAEVPELPFGHSTDLLMTDRDSALLLHGLTDCSTGVSSVIAREFASTGQEIFRCELDTAEAEEGALLSNGRLFVQAIRAGATRLESYDVGARDISPVGWSMARGSPSGDNRPR